MTDADDTQRVIERLTAQNEALAGLSDAIEIGDWGQAYRCGERFDCCAADLQHDLDGLDSDHPVRTSPVAISFATAIADKSRRLSSRLQAAREQLSQEHDIRLTQREAALAYSTT